MPPYQNESLHDMHVLMQQLDTLNAGHAPEHLEGIFDKLPKMPDYGITKTIKDTYNTTILNKDLQKEADWKNLQPDQRIIVFQNTFHDIIANMNKSKNTNEAWQPTDFDSLKDTIHSNAKTKILLQANMVPDPQLKSK